MFAEFGTHHLVDVASRSARVERPRGGGEREAGRGKYMYQAPVFFRGQLGVAAAPAIRNEYLSFVGSNRKMMRCVRPPSCPQSGSIVWCSHVGRLARF